MTESWYALRSKPRKEEVLWKQLLARDIEVYFPRIRVHPVNPRSRKLRPYFPGYMFVKLNLDDTGSNILRWMEGVHDLVRYGEEPAPVPRSLIDELKRNLEAFQERGKGDAGQLLTGEKIPSVDRGLAKHEAIFDAQLSGKDRVQVLLAYLFRPLERAQPDSSQFVKMDESSS